jgi:hypothetical protein
MATKRTQLVPLNVEAIPLKPIADLSVEQLVWTALVFDLLRDRFWTQDLRLPELSYTGQMVVEPAALVGASGALVKEGFYTPLELPPLTAADVSAEATASQWQRPSSGFNRWLVDRYGARVPELILNPVGDNAKLLLEERTKDPSFLPVVVGTDWDERGKMVPLKLETLDATGFGPKDRIVKDRAWVGRMNYVKAIQRLANEEYERTREDVLGWYRAAIERNREMLVSAVVREELLLPIWLAAQFAHRAASVTEVHNAVRVCLAKEQDRSKFLYLPTGGMTICGGHTDRWMCLDYPQTPASIYGKITITCPEAIAIVTATPIEQLPWALQHWRTDDPYVGNSILDRLDPEDWQLDNPWRPDSHRGGGIRLDIGVALSKSAHNERRKALGLPRKEWPTPAPVKKRSRYE